MNVSSTEPNADWIDERLSASFAALDLGATPEPRYARSRTPLWRRKRLSLLGGIPLLLTPKAAAAAAAVVLATGGGIATKAVVTGDANPLHWGSTVTQQVQTCREQVAAGSPGLGPCVSDGAKQHGANPAPHIGTPPNQPTHPTPPSHATGAPIAAPPTPPSNGHQPAPSRTAAPAHGTPPLPVTLPVHPGGAAPSRP